MRYYWCVNCGHYGDFKKDKQRNLWCKECDYVHIIKLEPEEYEEHLEDVRKGHEIIGDIDEAQ